MNNSNSIATALATLFREYDPEICRWKSLDPKLKDFPSESPFSAMGNNPIMNTDVLGDYAVYHHYIFTFTSMLKLGYSKSQADIVAHYASTYADNPGVLLATAQLCPYRKGIDYSGTKNSQHTWDIISSTGHSMRADYENISFRKAKKRGLEFGWSKIIEAGEFANNNGGVDKLKANSKGIQALGQGLHALEDAYGHEGVDMENHSVPKDISAPKLEYALSITNSALIITEVLSGNIEHLIRKNGIVLNLSGATPEQVKLIQEKIHSSLNETQRKETIIVYQTGY